MFNSIPSAQEVTTSLRLRYGQDNVLTITRRDARSYSAQLHDGRVVEAGISDDGSIVCREYGVA